jgi:hypothetical protein
LMRGRRWEVEGGGVVRSVSWMGGVGGVV